MLNKDYIDQIKINNLTELYKLFQNNNENSNILFLLDNLGHLPVNFDGNVLLPLVESDISQIRLLAVKNLAKLENISYLDKFFSIAKNDDDTSVKREAVSAIGRLRNKKAIPYLFEMLNDADPKVVSQAIRGLLVFKEDKIIAEQLKVLIYHPNETIQNVIRSEFYHKPQSADVLHTVSPDFMKNVVVQGDVQEILRFIPDESIHLTFTSPPYYNARDYAIYRSYQVFIEFLESVFKEVYRVTKEGRFFILNTSPVIVPRVSRQYSSKRYPIPFDIHHYLIKMGWEFIDDIVWLKPETCVKNRNGGFQQHRKPLAYKPNAVTEYLMVYRKQTSKLLDWNIKQYDLETVNQSRVAENYETTNVWRIDPTFDKVHSAVFPIELCNRVIKFYSFKGDLVFDPFGGSGTLGVSARHLGRFFLLTEKEEKYVERMRENLGVRNLFTQNEQKFLTLQEFQRLCVQK
jgi:DNA modification methylase